MTLYTKEDVAAALAEIKKVAEFNTFWTMAEIEGLPDPLSREAAAFENSKREYQLVDGSYPKVKEYKELEGEILPGSGGMSAREMARLINFLKVNGNYSLCQTQDVGNCQYAAVQRGTQLKREVSSMHLRRYIVMEMCKQPQFFCNYLHKSLATHYGHDRISPEELAERERAGTISMQDAADQRLPGPFTFHSYLQHLATDRSWGDVHSLTILSCLWQITITVLHTDQLNEHRIRHNRPLKDADLVLIFTGGNHYMGTGKYYTATGSLYLATV